jgi:signal transduction histidine kinase
MATNMPSSIETRLEQPYEHSETCSLVSLVEDASERVRTEGESAFEEFRATGSRWQQDETYVFVLDPAGNMLVHPDPELEGTNTIALQDVSGKPIVRGLIGAATTAPGKQQGWYHYQWPVPEGVLPRWKSSYVRRVEAPSGRYYIVGAGMYNDRMERAFVVDAVLNAAAEIEQRGAAAFPLLRDPAGPFIAKDAYIFVLDLAGTELFNPAFSGLEGRNVLQFTDTQGKYVLREMIELVRTRGSGWVDYMWPKPGDSVSTRKSAYVSGAQLGGARVVVGCGVYLADAPRETQAPETMTAPELMALVREGAALLQQQGTQAYSEFRQPGSKWFQDNTYCFVLTLEGLTEFHAAEPQREGKKEPGIDPRGRPFIRMMLDVGAGDTGEGWVHYLWHEPESIFPAWKSTFVKRVTLPTGETRILGCGIYNMPMDKVFIEDLVNRAAGLIGEGGRDAFPKLRDESGPFVFMDTYVFVMSPEGIELMNPAYPSLEGRDLKDVRDLRGNPAIQDEIDAAMSQGSAWLECYWYRPGDNVPARKLTYVRKVEFGGESYIVGSGIYQD